MKEAFIKFAIDLASGAVAGACAVLAATDLNTANPKILAIAIFVGAINGAINAARRYAVSKAS
jgi:ribose/xylose/arabinose/galactoside ABC-type transport system permease subunit